MIDFADFDTDPNTSAPVVRETAEAIRAAAHLANGGDALFPCPKCKGSGQWGSARSYDWKACFACKGKGKVSKGVAAAAKGKVTKAVNLAERKAEFASANPALMAGLREISSWHNFARELLGKFEEYGTLTDGQVVAALASLAKVKEAQAARAAARSAENAGKSGEVGVDRITALFATATAAGLKKPVFRTSRLVIKPAKQHPGTLYVTDKALAGAYVGKIVAGKFEARREAAPDTLALLCAIATDPMKAATDYGRSTGECGCCGRELTDPESVKAGIGPICATKWGI
ncbi:hypothetical protein EB230_17370 [Mesorhizobium sp. NZP2234]|uniref:DUF6011 domain-containing protein n=1 Tax=Mesorhizobium sp. NZP2234 TaxID=2483402 RepID=UPI0015582CEC|nr:DUF6011 domain-containing protein [Mesorhizobium sp. NZP2234]QKC89979.1 hypothetical protein EB230_17370 [Mesorhizobium sp. NZP2234]